MGLIHSVQQSASGPKHDSGKPPLGLVPKELIEGAARAFSFGAEKYGRHSFRRGIEVQRLLDATLRHLHAWNAGENDDQESGLSHLDHAAASLSMVIWTALNRPDLDDRYKAVSQTQGDARTSP